MILMSPSLFPVFMKKVELLAPAGSMEGLIGAISAGADAIYLAGNRFGARAFAENFSDEELLDAIRKAHLFGRKIYLTVNTLTRQDELSELIRFTAPLYKAGLDGAIIQDLGVLSRLRENFPKLSLHASTQMSVTGSEEVRFLKRLGVCRIVPARELSLSEIREIKDKEDIEIEAFVHGAMCYSYSGRCLMSSFLGGRSGNRGRCAGTCRLPFDILDENGDQISKGGEFYPLSMKDLYVLRILPELIDAGIDSFKIEGRMKKPEYAAGVTAMYRKYIDRFYEWDSEGRKAPWIVEKRDEQELLSLYIRSDLHDGYYHTRNGAELITKGKPGYAGADEALLSDIRLRYLSALPKIPVCMQFDFLQGEEARLSAWISKTPSVAACCRGPVIQKAEKRPMSKEDLLAKISKTGDTVFTLDKAQINTDGDSFLPVSAVASLKRDVLKALEKELLRYNEEPEDAQKESEEESISAKSIADSDHKDTFFEMPVSPGRFCNLDLNASALSGRIALVLTQEQYDAAFSCNADMIITEDPDLILSDSDHVVNLLALPQILRSDGIADIQMLIHDRRFDGFLVRTLWELEILYESGYHGIVIGDACLYQWNRDAARILSHYMDMAVLPAELSGNELMRTFGQPGVLSHMILNVYGRTPLMVTAGCLRKTCASCRGKETGLWYLKDRKKQIFPTRTVCRFCHNVIYNSVPLSLHDLKDPLIHACGAALYSFTDESESRVREILSGAVPEHFTRGHYKKGAD